MAHVTSDGQITKIDGLVCEERALATLLSAHPEPDWPGLVERALSVGAHGLVTMGLDVGLGEVREQVRREVEEATGQAEARVAAMLEAARLAYQEQLDPEVRSSLLSRSLRDFHRWQEAFFSGMDVDQAGSIGGRLVTRLEGLVGRGGTLESQLAAALDPATDGSALARLRDEVVAEIRQLRDAVHVDLGKRTEAEMGTRKGFEFEDTVEERVRAWAAGIGGCVVERTSTTGGALGREALVGDVVVELPDGGRIVLEVKNVSRIGLGGNGILAELDRAMANRRADAAICVSAGDAYPAEVGSFGVYGARILAVDEGPLLDVALRVASLQLAARPANADAVDRAALLDQLDRIGQLAKRFSSTKRTLTEAQNSIELAKDGLDCLRSDLVDLTEAAAGQLRGIEAA
ncbi:MAG: hypothetical protein HKN74_10665 [Acidimicrobiia bacterium]|nr:hypothetical protein [Acidimicrobiia bacterium]NNF10737.1 hypothetical protein [Acidimicrobiia bacterium]NNL68395.1 hypothetical protein [Acidimicrobiia bacterium]